MLVRLADRLRRQDEDVQVVRQSLQHLAHHAFADHGVGRHGQMRPVLLDRRHGEHRDRRLRIEADEVGW